MNIMFWGTSCSLDRAATVAVDGFAARGPGARTSLTISGNKGQ